MKVMKIIVTYEAQVPDDVSIDEFHNRFEDYIDQDMNVWLIRDDDRDCEQIKVRLKKWQTNSEQIELTTLQK